MSNTIVTRFAPSPTGFMHIGNLRTALYAYLLAKSAGGTFILRIEDTDRERLVPGAVEIIKDTLRVTGLLWDEGPEAGGPHGPYVQSERLPIYKEYAELAIEKGFAYRCFCTRERLDSLHEEEGVGGGYDRHCRDLPQEEIDRLLASGAPYVVRQRMPLSGATAYDDAVFGHISIENEQLQDQILMKQDGYPTYNFAHVVDDHLMGVTHVVRGSEYLTSTPKYVLLYDGFGWERPVYVHLPMIMGKNSDGSVSKLSKRHGSVGFGDLVAQGYLPAAILNCIALMGWSPKGEREIFSLPELVREFSLDGLSKSPAVFDYDKLKYFNGEYIRALPPEAFAEAAGPYLGALSGNPQLPRILALVQPRLETLAQLPEKAGFFAALPDYDAALFENKKNKVTREGAQAILAQALPALRELPDWNNDALFACLSALAERLGLKTGAVMWAVRIAAAGLAATPGGATEILEILGRGESLKRLETGMDKLR